MERGSAEARKALAPQAPPPRLVGSAAAETRQGRVPRAAGATAAAGPTAVERAVAMVAEAAGATAVESVIHRHRPHRPLRPLPRQARALEIVSDALGDVVR